MNPVLHDIILVAGGIGLFLFGMKMMSTGLQTLAGDRLQGILKRATSNRFLAIIVGIIATIALNSSTAVTVMTVSFVNSALMNLTQAIGIIMGANVGTTFSAQLVAFRIDAYAPLFIFVGMVMYLFFKKRKVKNIGSTILGFGILFFGITTMGGPLRELGNNETFTNLLTTFEFPILALLAGFIFTAIVQSSTATTSILVMMYLNGVPIPFETGAYIILGTNIGTSITAVIASIPASRESKRAALFHIMFDIMGSIVFGTLIFIIPAILNWFQSTWPDPARQIAMFHTLYNVATVTLLIPFVPRIARLMERIVPVRPDEVNNKYEKKLIYLDDNDISTPSLAVHNAHLEIHRMGKIANETLALSLESFFENNMDKADRTIENENVINYLNHNISSKLVWINNMSLSDAETERIGKMFKLLSDIERIGDHAENIAEFAITINENKLKFSDNAIEELKTLSETTMNLSSKALNVYEKQKTDNLSEIESLEKEVDKLSLDFAENHIVRLKAGKCEPKSGVIFSDMLVDLERCGDHSKSIAFSVLTENEWKKKRNSK
ncbi:MAG: Na/Pi cotransporter family protein [Oscillospiraceae bacterium]|nr:Na/Pi cotransporter family protein [Oscillospiraceae bacterium]